MQLEKLSIATSHRPTLELAVPGSKSLTNRALVLAALGDGVTRLTGALVAEDTEVMRRALTQLGFEIVDRDGTLEIAGLGGRIPRAEAALDLRLSGTSIRFLAALVALGRGRFLLDGNARMRERPIGDLLAALDSLGAKTTTLSGNGCPPLSIEASGLSGGVVEVAGDRSSQYLSGLLMVSPYAGTETVLRVTGELQSKPFVDMTLSMMADFGVAVDRTGYEEFRITPATYRARDYTIEGDAMAAGYFWAAAAVTEGRVKVLNVGRDSLQGDRRMADVLERMGCEVTWGNDWCEVVGPADGTLRGGSFDLNDMPDQAQTLAVVALFADSAVEIRNVWNLRIKETDRLGALTTELRRFGAKVEEHHDGLVVHPPAEVRPARVETYGDHRMAMAFAVAGLRVAGTEIVDPGCVAKTYPAFFDDLAVLAATGVVR